MTIEILGIDNVLFDVADLDAAVAFYERCGFRLRWCSHDKGIALFAIGSETPGLLLRRANAPVGAGCLWVEVRDARSSAAGLETLGLRATCIETASGVTSEVRDPSGNRIGFADYSRKPELGRSHGR